MNKKLSFSLFFLMFGLAGAVMGMQEKQDNSEDSKKCAEETGKLYSYMKARVEQLNDKLKENQLTNDEKELKFFLECLENLEKVKQISKNIFDDNTVQTIQQAKNICIKIDTKLMIFNEREKELEKKKRESIRKMSLIEIPGYEQRFADYIETKVKLLDRNLRDSTAKTMLCKEYVTITNILKEIEKERTEKGILMSQNRYQYLTDQIDVAYDRIIGKARTFYNKK